MELPTVEETFARLKLLKVFDFYKTRELTQEQREWVQFICDRYEGQEEKVFKGLVALAVEKQAIDWRDSMMVLVLLYHSAAKIGADASQLFQRAAAISTPQTSEGFLQFSARAPEKLDLAKCGYQEGKDSEGNFAYVSK